jgi:hypothetical protein
MFSTPHNLLELLQNLHTAFVRDLVSRDDFFLEENLKALSGARAVRSLDVNPAATRFSMKVEGVFRPGQADPAGIPDMQYSITRTIKASGRVVIDAHLTFQVEQDELRLKEIEAIFGTGWADFYPLPVPAGWPQGLKRIRYVVDNNHVSREIVMMFLPDGGLQSCRITQGEEIKPDPRIEWLAMMEKRRIC